MVELSELGIVDQVDYLLNELSFAAIDASFQEGVWFIKINDQQKSGLFYLVEGEKIEKIGPGKRIHIDGNWYYVRIGLT